MSACGLLGMTGLGNGALFDARQLFHTGGGTPPLPVAIGTGGKFHTGTMLPLRGSWHGEAVTERVCQITALSAPSGGTSPKGGGSRCTAR